MEPRCMSNKMPNVQSAQAMPSERNVTSNRKDLGFYIQFLAFVRLTRLLYFLSHQRLQAGNFAFSAPVLSKLHKV